MTFSSVLIIVFIFVLSGLFISRPFLVESEIRGRSSSSRYDSLIAEKERLLSAIEELDLELDLKKISSKEHTRNRDILLVEAAEVLKQLDKVQKPDKGKKKVIDQSIAQDDLEKMIAARREELRSEKSNLCPACGKPVLESDQFCSHCGEAL